mgnify:CR=1 FL=1
MIFILDFQLYQEGHPEDQGRRRCRSAEDRAGHRPGPDQVADRFGPAEEETWPR